MYELDAYKFREEIRIFRNTIAPTPKQQTYLTSKKEEVRNEMMEQARKTGLTMERCVLTAICGTLRTKQEQAEFASRLILLDILTE